MFFLEKKELVDLERTASSLQGVFFGGFLVQKEHQKGLLQADGNQHKKSRTEGHVTCVV